MLAHANSNPEDAFMDREFPMSDRAFHQLRHLAYDYTGIKLSRHKQEMIYGRLSRRMRSLKLLDFEQYCELICDRDNPEVSEFINAISTNLTSFFREPYHFEFLKNTIFPQILRDHERRIRIWSAGCSSGEEPYSIAMSLLEELSEKRDLDLKILATDLDSTVLEKARNGIYPLARVEGLDKSVLHRFFEHNSKEANYVRIKEKVRELVHFKRLNLLEDWPMHGKFDVIFCRNVIIYFDDQTQRRLFERYAEYLKPNGYIFVGHSETLHGISGRFRSLGKTMYQLK